MTNTLIRVLPVTLIWVLGHTLIWISSNNLYMVYHCLIVLMLYILSFIAVMAWRLCATFVVLFILTVPDLEGKGVILQIRNCQNKKNNKRSTQTPSHHSNK